MDWIRKKNQTGVIQIQNGSPPPGSQDSLIPPIFHVIWLGGNEMPRIYNEYVLSWALTYTECKFMLWHDKNIPSNLMSGNLINKVPSVVCKADILRYELMYKYGGVYIDMDFLSIHRMPPSTFFGTFFGCESSEFITNSIIGSYPKNPVFLRILNALRPNIESFGYKETNISLLSGPRFITSLYHADPSIFKDVRFYDSHHFYKYTFQDKHSGVPFVFEEYAKDKTIYGVHMWGNSWGKDYVPTTRIGEFPASLLLLEKKEVIQYPYTILSSEPCELHARPFRKSIAIIGPVIFTGGIERQISMIVNDDEFMADYDFYVVAPAVVRQVYKMSNGRTTFIISPSHELTNRILHDIRPDIIMDNTMLYYTAQDMAVRYSGINMNKVVVINHTSTLYDKDITDYHIQRMVHLYKEEDMHISFYDIPNTCVIPNGCKEMSEPDKLRISVIGRISDDKIDMGGLKVLERLDIDVHFYGEIRTGFDITSFPKNCKVHPHQDVWKILDETDSQSCVSGILSRQSTYLVYNIPRRCIQG
jgi:hypothetical protein